MLGNVNSNKGNLKGMKECTPFFGIIFLFAKFSLKATLCDHLTKDEDLNFALVLKTKVIAING